VKSPPLGGGDGTLGRESTRDVSPAQRDDMNLTDFLNQGLKRMNLHSPSVFEQIGRVTAALQKESCGFDVNAT
jgi:hypothetical protein